jgi:hypothetical protein
MPSILLAWELGSGLGHLVPLRAIGIELARRGHQVAIATNNVPLCEQGFAGTGIAVLAAPQLPLSTRRLKIPCTYSDILHDCGYSSAQHLTVAVKEWLRLFDTFRPDLLLCDHSPTALIASRTRDFATAALGTGFVCPPDMSPLPSLHPQITEPHWAAEVEQTVLDNMNDALASVGAKPVERVTQIFGDVNCQYFLTVRELDHYATWRGPETRYWPPVATLPGIRCEWPTGASSQGPRVFIYLRGDAPILPILRGLAVKKIATVCCAPHMSNFDRNSFGGTSVVVHSSPVDIRPLIDDCDAAVLNGGHGAVYTLMRAGVSMLLLPLMLEQQVTARRIFEMGVGLQAPVDDLNLIATGLESLLYDGKYKTAASDYAKRNIKLESKKGQVRMALKLS